MSNTTPDSPEEKPEGFGSEANSTGPVGATSYDGALNNSSSNVETEPGQSPATEPVAAEPGAEEPVAAEPTVAESDNGQAQHSEPVTEVAPTSTQSQNSYSEPPAGQYQAEPGYAQPVTPIYVTAPNPPKDKGNRGVGILIVLVATLIFAAVSAAVVFVIFAITKSSEQVANDFSQYLSTPSYYVPIIFFALVYILVVAIVNRGGWWAYILGSFFIAVVLYFVYVGSVMLSVHAWDFTPDQAQQLLSQLWSNPLTIAIAIVAREVSMWFGAWIASRGRRVRQRNIEAQRAYDREYATGSYSTASSQ